MKSFSSTFAPTLFATFTALIALGLSPSASASDHASFKDTVLPILTKHCAECHTAGGEGLQASGLDLSSYEGVMKGTDHGPVVVPGDAFTSNIMVLIDGRAGPELKMPHGRKDLSRQEKVLLRRWINRGAHEN